MRGTRWAEIVPELAPEAGDVVLEKGTCEVGLRYFRDWHATDPERQFKTADEVIASWREAAWHSRGA
jgi:hypothetical protein